MTRLTTLIERFENFKANGGYESTDANCMYVDPIQCAIYEEDHGQNGYILDVEGAKDTILIDLPCVTACYYWLENNELKSEPFNYSEDAIKARQEAEEKLYKPLIEKHKRDL